jgi:hypothetical protein
MIMFVAYLITLVVLTLLRFLFREEKLDLHVESAMNCPEMSRHLGGELGKSNLVALLQNTSRSFQRNFSSDARLTWEKIALRLSSGL